jgi:ribose-phosphate pyrophosphokinase
MNDCILFSGNASKELGYHIVNNSGGDIELGQVEHTQFPSGEWYCQFKQNIRGADVYLLNSITKPANDNLMQLLIMADAARRASAGRMTAVIPYMGYSRQDRKDKSRVPISAKLVMDILQAAGFDRIVTMDLHAPQVAGFTNLPFDHLQFRPSLLEALKDKHIDIVVAPDMGAVKKSEEYARKMNLDLAIISKKRTDSSNVKATHFIGDVKDKNVLIVDDLTESAGTLVEASTQCKNNGAKSVVCSITHGCFTSEGYNRMIQAFEENIINHLFVSNTVDGNKDWYKSGGLYGHGRGVTIPNFKDRVTYVDVSSIFAKAIISIHENESVSSLFI